MQPVKITVLRCILLFTAILFVPGSLSSTVSVSVLLHRPIRLTCTVNKTLPRNLVSWRYERVSLLDTSHKPYYTYQSQFTGRLEVSEDLVELRIQDLRMEDSGMFNADITYADGKGVFCVFNVTVYEPVPHPSVEIKQKNKTGDWCNVTLHCSVPKNSSSLSYSWKPRPTASIYHLKSQTGDSIQISLNKDSWDSDFLCTVQNPVDEKYSSVLKICNEVTERLGNAGFWVRHHVITILITSLVVIGVIVVLVLLLRKYKNRIDHPPKDEKKEPKYIQVMTYKSKTPPHPRSKVATVYSEVRHPEGIQG